MVAHDILRGLPLPWVKCMGGVAHLPDQIPLDNGSALRESFTAGCQSLDSCTDVLVSAHGLVTRDGEFLASRVPAALAKLSGSEGADWRMTGASTDLIGEGREARRPDDFCFMCTMMEGRCAACRDRRSWSILMARHTLLLAAGGEDAERRASITIKGRILPFLSTSDDDAMREETLPQLTEAGFKVLVHRSDVGDEESQQEGEEELSSTALEDPDEISELEEESSEIAG
uniref:Uncharacterized protein n=1 Tax=Pyrodinium bahamense TaxID=73915 RepID=A0A7S0AAN7_9DINO